MTGTAGEARVPRPSVHLLQGYDEYLSSYGDSRDIHDPSGHAGVPADAATPFVHAVVVDGRLVGRWRRRPRRRSVGFELQLVSPLTRRQRTALEREAQRYGAFVGLPVVLDRGGPADL